MAQRRAVRCRAVSCPACGAVLCRAVPCFAECFISCIPDDNAINRKHTELVGQSRHVCPRAFYAATVFIFHCCRSFPIVFWTATNILERYVCSNKQQYRSMYEYYIVETRAQQSTAQPPCERQQTKYVLIRVRIERNMYVTACCVSFVFLEHGTLCIGKSPVRILNFGPSTLHLSVIPIHASL